MGFGLARALRATGLALAAGRSFVANNWWRAAAAQVPDENMLAEPAVWGEIDYGQVESPNLEGRMQWRIARAAVMHGYYAWFDGEMAPGLGYSNAPQLPELVYGRAFFPLEQAVGVEEGDQVDARFSGHLVAGKYVFRWDTRITGRDGAIKAEFKQTTFKDRPLSPAQLGGASPSHISQLGIDGRVDLLILQGIAAGESLGTIAQTLQAHHPERFPDAHAALNQVVRLSARYAQPG